MRTAILQDVRGVCLVHADSKRLLLTIGLAASRYRLLVAHAPTLARQIPAETEKRWWVDTAKILRGTDRKLPLLVAINANVEWPGACSHQPERRATAQKQAALEGFRMLAAQESVDAPAYMYNDPPPTWFGKRATTIDHVLLPQNMLANVLWMGTMPQITLSHAGMEDHHLAAVRVSREVVVRKGRGKTIAATSERTPMSERLRKLFGKAFWESLRTSVRTRMWEQAMIGHALELALLGR